MRKARVTHSVIGFACKLVELRTRGWEHKDGSGIAKTRSQTVKCVSGWCHRLPRLAYSQLTNRLTEQRSNNIARMQSICLQDRWSYHAPERLSLRSNVYRRPVVRSWTSGSSRNEHYGHNCRAMLCISATYAVVRYLSVTFVYCVETAKDTAIWNANRKPHPSSRIVPFFQWPSVTSNADFKVTILFNVK